MTPQQTIQKIAEKAKVLSIPDNLGLAKVLIEISDAIAQIKIPETDLSDIENRLEKLDNKLDEPVEVELEIT